MHGESPACDETGIPRDDVASEIPGSPGSTSSVPASNVKIPHARGDDKKPLLVKYEMGTKLGKGAFGTVRLVTRISTREVFACKIIRKKAKGSAPMTQIEREVEIMKLMRHKHVVQLVEVYETPKKIYLVMEYCNGGELVKKVQLTNTIEDKDIRLVIRRLSEVVGYMHDRGIVHRDIKPENILLSTQNPEDPYNIKVSDFGLAAFTTGNKLMENVCGTPLYMAPEVVAGLGYSHSCDIWSIGVMMGLLLAKYTRKAELDFREMVSAGQVATGHLMWATCSNLAKSLLDRMLQSDPAKRISAKEIVVHPWITGGKDEGCREDSHTVLEMMKRYRSELRWRTAIFAVIAVNRFQTLLKNRAAATAAAKNDLQHVETAPTKPDETPGARRAPNHGFGGTNAPRKVGTARVGHRASIPNKITMTNLPSTAAGASISAGAGSLSTPQHSWSPISAKVLNDRRRESLYQIPGAQAKGSRPTSGETRPKPRQHSLQQQSQQPQNLTASSTKPKKASSKF